MHIYIYIHMHIYIYIHIYTYIYRESYIYVYAHPHHPHRVNTYRVKAEPPNNTASAALLPAGARAYRRRNLRSGRSWLAPRPRPSWKETASPGDTGGGVSWPLRDSLVYSGIVHQVNTILGINTSCIAPPPVVFCNPYGAVYGFPPAPRYWHSTYNTGNSNIV